MKSSVFKFTLAIAAILLHASCSSQIPRTDPKSETYRQQMAQRASTALLTARSLPVPASAEITAWLLQENFEEIEKRSRYYEEQTSKNPLYESPLFNLYESLDPYDGNLQKKLDKWVQERPSHVSCAMRGIYKAGQGWLIRGDKFVKDTPPENFEGMHLFHEEAKRDLLEAVKRNKKLAPAYSALIAIEMASGNIEGATSIHDRSVRSIPQTYYVRHAYLGALRPKWGGSFELMQEYADGLDKAAQKNPRIWSLKGEPAAERGQVAWHDSDYVSAIQHFTEALSYGDRLTFLKYRGRLYMLANQDSLALEDFLRYKKYEDADKVVNAYVISLTAKLGLNPPQK
ncbi:MAG: hypothetical protein L0Z48_11720 [candidate division Zixibacteria bacterium]|nr:hypothetical protein [candidate division Zixibacteria bacterium]MCI0597191.1 hypothetical protein [candidate division Zixibacteria bacterium]